MFRLSSLLKFNWKILIDIDAFDSKSTQKEVKGSNASNDSHGPEKADEPLAMIHLNFKVIHLRDALYLFHYP